MTRAPAWEYVHALEATITNLQTALATATGVRVNVIRIAHPMPDPDDLHNEDDL